MIKINHELTRQIAERDAAIVAANDKRTGIFPTSTPGEFVFQVEGKLKCIGSKERCLSRMKRKRVRLNERI